MILKDNKVIKGENKVGIGNNEWKTLLRNTLQPLK